MAVIRRHSEPTQWRHVSSKDNATDVASRGCHVNSLPPTWAAWPPFLSSHKSAWPSSKPLDVATLDLDPEVQRQPVICTEVSAAARLEHPLE